MDQKTIDTYNKMAREYDDETISFWDRFPRNFIDLFVKLSGDNILDVGSGPGRDGMLLKISESLLPALMLRKKW